MSTNHLPEIYADTHNGILFGVQNTKVVFCSRTAVDTEEGQETHDVSVLVMPTDALFDLAIDILNGLKKNQSFIVTKNIELAESLDKMLSSTGEALAHAGLAVELKSPTPAKKGAQKAKPKRKIAV
ncbi:hypothetical protein [Ralstonia sp.]|uniref:hypothetical protein n=1 Tax=Ralstonia sp. TaxID=54061 RepID=UPI002C2DECCB|nr:hypothetical protein [Ralstonia sp.]HWV03524.1 hypothetical protein [Ralstonia sp.]